MIKFYVQLFLRRILLNKCIFRRIDYLTIIGFKILYEGNNVLYHITLYLFTINFAFFHTLSII